MNIEPYTSERIDDVIRFEKDLRKEENFWGWEIDDAYIQSVKQSFQDERFRSSVSLLAYMDEKVVGRIDSTLICSHFDGSIKAYLDWICVLKSYRHKGAAQALMAQLRKVLYTQYRVNTLIGLIAGNPEAQRFYHGMERAMIRDQGIWIELP